jgi:hypothetical protein
MQQASDGVRLMRLETLHRQSQLKQGACTSVDDDESQTSCARSDVEHGAGNLPLATLSARALLLRAEEMGIDEAAIDAADEAEDRKGALLELIERWAAVEKEATSSTAAVTMPAAEADDGLAQLRAELASLSATRLLKRAEEVGDIDEAQIDAADDADDRKQALTALLIAHHQHKKQQQQVEIPSQLQAEFCEVPILEDEV